LTEKMEQKIAVLRDGTANHLLTRLLVPGDVILLIGGAAVPADVEWLEGDVLSIDTAALTGEPLPRKYPSEEYGPLILCGATVVAGEAYCVVRKTGINTEIGGSQAEIMKDKTTKKISVFEEKVLLSVKIIILCAVVDVLIIFLVQGIGRHEFDHDVRELIASCLSIIIASVPVALPLVLQVTMALGAGKMARKYNAVVTSLPALQDISSMSILCSDKTGTLTTAKISIIQDAVWCADDFSKDDVAFYAGLASNRDKKEDPIDRAVIQHFDRVCSATAKDSVREYQLKRAVGFNPIYKRVLYEFNHPILGNIVVAKGLPNKIVDTADGGVDDADDQWKVDHSEALQKIVADTDAKLSKSGYKTLGVCVKIGAESKFRFVGILPMLDPPRHDTAQTIRNLKNAGVKVKMITGDHLNIAKETAKLIGMGINMHKGDEIRESSQIRDEMILQADGFAQVLPRDKREVVLVLKNVFHYVVGMTGDGVNDAPALSAAQCGIAVDDSTDAAKNAAAIILTSPGLSAIYMGIIESRRIFRKLKSYIVYRFAATIQIVIVLTLLIYIANCPIDSLYIILLALFNDLTLLPIAYDRQHPSATPEFPRVTPILITALCLGLVETALSLLWAFASESTGFFKSDFDIFACSKSAQAGVWVQMFIAAEILVFSARCPTFFFMSLLPSPYLFISVFLGCLVVSILACAASYFGSLYVQDVAIIWLYDLICLVVVDAIKVLIFNLLGENFEVLKIQEEHEEPVPSVSKHPVPERTKTKSVVEEVASPQSSLRYLPVGEGGEGEGVDEIRATRSLSSLIQMDKWKSMHQMHSPGAPGEHVTVTPTMARQQLERGRSLSNASASSIALKRHASTTAVAAAIGGGDVINIPRSDSRAGSATNIVIPTAARITVAKHNSEYGSMIDLSRRNLSSMNLRPYTPANQALKR
jgi:H+-transporting ATPase